MTRIYAIGFFIRFIKTGLRLAIYGFANNRAININLRFPALKEKTKKVGNNVLIG